MKRPGAFALSTESWDLEIFDFIDVRKTSGDERRRAHNIQLCISYSDLHMKRAMENGDWTLFDPADVPFLTETWGDKFEKEYLKYEQRYQEQPELFNRNTKVVKARDVLQYHFNSWCDVGVPYFLFKDNANRNYKYNDINIIRQSNLCVTGDTCILTRQYGNIPISLLVDSGISKVECWNGDEWSETEIFQTSEGQHTLQVILDNGITIDATPYHKWYYIDKNYKVKETTTKGLVPGMKLVKSNFILSEHGDKEMICPYENGLFAGDGCEYKKPMFIDNEYTEKIEYILHLYNEKIVLANYRNNIIRDGNIYNSNINSIRKTVVLNPETMYGKIFVPGLEFTLESRLKWLAGLIDADGCLLSNQGAQSIQITSVDYLFLRRVYMMLIEMGITSTLRKRKNAGYRLLPTNKKDNEYAPYFCQTSYILMISGENINKLLDLGYRGFRIIPTKHNYNRTSASFTKVVKVIDNGDIYPTYCGNEPKKHMLVFNGQLTGNCNEIIQPTGDDYTGVCNLGSINLSRVNKDEDLERITKLALRALDNYIDLTPYPSNKARRFQSDYRSTGIGSMGEAEYLANNKIYYGSDKHKIEIERIWKTISDSALTYSQELAKEKGGCGIDKTVRNALRHAIAPNSSSGIFAGTTNGLEPVYAQAWVEVSQKGQVVITAPHLNLDNAEYYKNAFEVDMIKQLEINAIRGKYIDMSQSQNVFIQPDENGNISIGKLSKCVFTAWKLGVKTLYYLRTKAPKNNICFNCEN